MISGVIYKTTNLVNGKWYIGKDERNRPWYLGSGILLRKAVQKYGKENFRKEILDNAKTKEDLAELEKKIITETNAVNDPMSYNLAAGGKGGHSWGNYPEEYQQIIKQKMKKTEEEKEERRKFAIENNLAQYIIDGRDKGRKIWWQSLTDEEKFQYQSSRSSGWWDKLTEEEQKSLSGIKRENTKKYLKSLSDEDKKRRIENQRNKISKTYELISPEGEIITTNRLKETANEIKISYATLLISCKEKRQVKNGWICKIKEKENGIA